MVTIVVVVVCIRCCCSYFLSSLLLFVFVCLRCCCSYQDTLVRACGRNQSMVRALICLILLYVVVYEYKYSRRFSTESERFFFSIFNTIEIQDLLCNLVIFLGFSDRKGTRNNGSQVQSCQILSPTSSLELVVECIIITCSVDRDGFVPLFCRYCFLLCTLC
jgi:hypothetical protein